MYLFEANMERFHGDQMKMLTLTVLLFTLVQNVKTNVTVFGQIEKDTRFYYRELPTFPSILAEIKYSIRFKKIDKMISLDIYTTEDDWNRKTNCSKNVYGHLINENLHTPMRARSKPYRFTTCVPASSLGGVTPRTPCPPRGSWGRGSVGGPGGRCSGWIQF